VKDKSVQSVEESKKWDVVQMKRSGANEEMFAA
jgi:hypothetical protein